MRMGRTRLGLHSVCLEAVGPSGPALGTPLLVLAHSLNAQYGASLSGTHRAVSTRQRFRLYLYRTVENLEMFRVFKLSFRLV